MEKEEKIPGFCKEKKKRLFLSHLLNTYKIEGQSLSFQVVKSRPSDLFFLTHLYASVLPEKRVISRTNMNSASSLSLLSLLSLSFSNSLDSKR